MTAHAAEPPNPEFADFYRRIDGHELAPLWEVLHKLVAPQPITRAVPHVWKYDEVRPYLEEAGELISAAQAERRVLILENPAWRGEARVADSLFAGLQMILPGEVAPAHRHSPSALRLIVEGGDAYTAVDGEKSYMQPGDFIITPSWSWHDHGHEGENMMVWLDGLDLPLVRFFGATFAEQYADAQFPTNAPPGYTRARYGANMKPVDDGHAGDASPIFSYPYEEAREALERMRGTEDWDACHGLKMEYINPLTGGPAMPTMSTFLQLLPGGFTTAPYRSTEHAVYSVVEGTGRAIVGEGDDAVTLDWGPRDHFVVPGWARHTIAAGADAVLFSFSDRTTQRKLGIWREDRAGA